jgi:hypothetical protein
LANHRGDPEVKRHKGTPFPEWQRPDLAEPVMRRMLDAERRFENERRQLYRVYLDTFVTTASPLLIDVADEWQVDVPAMLRQMVPPFAWPLRWRAHVTRPAGDLLASHRGRNIIPILGVGWLPRNLDRRRNERLSLEVLNGTLQTRFQLGRARCYGVDGQIEVWVPGELPGTLVAAALGRPLAAIVDHPLFQRRPYPIEEIAVGVGDHTVIYAGAPALPMPAAWSASA